MRGLIGVAVLFVGVCSLAAFGAEMPPGEADAKATIEKSPRHGEWVEIAVPGAKTPLKAYVVYPEVKDKAGVVIVIHEIFGLSDWIRSVTDQLAADGFIAIAPDLLSGKGPGGGGTEAYPGRDAVVAAIRSLGVEEVTGQLNAVSEFAKKIPAANGKIGTVGFCWGGGQSFNYALNQPALNAAAVYYGPNPSDPQLLSKGKAPILGFYGGDDARVDATIPPAEKELKKNGRSYKYHIYEGAGHGFLRQQDGKDGANMKAAKQAWPDTIAFFKEHLK